MFSFITMTADAAATQSMTGASLYPLFFLIIMLVVLYFIMLRPQRKKEKADAEMRKNVQVGDEIETIGGIVGIITKVEDQTVVIETSADRCKMRIKKWAIAQNVSANEEANAKAAAAKAEKASKNEKADSAEKSEKAEKKSKKNSDKPIDKD